MNGEIVGLAYTVATGATLIALAALAWVGPRRALSLLRQLGLYGLFLALFVGVAVQTLAVSVVEKTPYTLAFLSTTDLRTQALLEDGDLRTRYNTDGRLRFIPKDGTETVINLESPYRLDAGPLREVDFKEAFHGKPVAPPAGVAPLSIEGNGDDLRKEVAGLYETAAATVGNPSSIRADLARDASVGFLLLGLVSFLSGLVPLVFRSVDLGGDSLRLVRATSHRSYRGVRGRAIRAGVSGLRDYHFGSARPFANLAVFGLLITLAGVLLGLAREDETRRQAREVFAQARHIRVEGASRKASPPL